MIAVLLSAELDRTKISKDIAGQGFSIVPGLLTREQCAALNAALWAIADKMAAAGHSTHIGLIDPTADNVRLNDLPIHDPAFLELVTNPSVCEAVESVIGGDLIISNFTANIARPGALPMRLHSDQALSVPEPWGETWVCNAIWCLDDVDEANGATHYLPGSHRITRLEDLPDNADALTRPFEAEAGSLILMDGRLWHRSGRNSTADRDRALLFGYYARRFLRPQLNWHEVMSAQQIEDLDDRQRQLFGFGTLANTHGLPLITLEGGEGLRPMTGVTDAKLSL